MNHNPLTKVEIKIGDLVGYADPTYNCVANARRDRTQRLENPPVRQYVRDCTQVDCAQVMRNCCPGGQYGVIIYEDPGKPAGAHMIGQQENGLWSSKRGKCERIDNIRNPDLEAAAVYPNATLKSCWCCP